ncbi:aminoglycoside adenylyltransferase domain-containing protein [Psychrobacillus sp. NPDC096426]|uniref:aminoglycoside adenylyltransferase domain-containing protein n=1 Tax=Psychrobacillus sp. NPDC096426 TaxID=3364491 RepID=UPI0038258CF8
MDKIPQLIHEVLDDYFHLLEWKLPNLLEGYYLYGSTSLGAFEDGYSDIDFIAIIKRKLTESDIKKLQEIHKDMQRKCPKTILDGFYIVKDDMLSLNEGKVSSVRFNDGKFNGFTEFNKNSIDAYQLKKYGIHIKGQLVEFNYEVEWNVLIVNMRNNLNTYWRAWISGRKRFPSFKYIGVLFDLHMVEWGVLGVSRLYYTFKEKDITSKVGAGEYALSVVPKKYHKIIKESMRLRQGNKKSYYQSIFGRRKDSMDYMEFMIRECNNLFE